MHRHISILSIEHPLEGALWRSVTTLLVLSVMLYLYFVSSSVLHIMARKTAISDAARLQSSIGHMESEYFALTESLSQDEARLIGLAPLSDTSYVFRPGNAAALDTDTIQRNAI